MLKTLLTCLFTCCVLVVTHAQKTDVQKLADHFHDKCTRNGQSAEVFNKLYADFDAFGSYLTGAFSNVPKDMNTFCKRERSQLTLWAKDIAEDLKPCLRIEEKYLAGFLNHSFNEFVHFLCHKEAKYTKQFFSSERTQCRERLSSDQTTELDQCFAKIFSPRSQFIAKNELCNDLTVAKECFSRNLEKKCPEARDYQKLNDHLFSYIRKPCSACSHYLSTLLLTLSVVLSYIVGH